MPTADKIVAPSTLEREGAKWRTEQMDEVSTRKQLMSAAAEGGADAMGQLKAVLAQHWMRVTDLLREWDEDGSGAVSKKEFLKALPILGLKVEREQAEELFATFDADGSGEVNLKELNRKLRIGAAIELDSKLQDGGAGDITLAAENPIALRDGPREDGSKLVGMALDPSSEEPIMDQLAQALSSSFARVVDVFREWDDDGSGTVTKREFRQALPLLGLKDVPRAEADALFDDLDRDHNGVLDYRELNARLRKRVAPEEMARRRAREAAASSEAVSATRRQAKKQALAALRAREADVMRRLVSAQRELRRSQSESAVAEAHARKRLAALEVRAEMDARVGRDVSARLAACECAPHEEVVALAQRLNAQLAQVAGSLPDAKHVTGPLWYALFKYMDDDGSGRIAYAELRRGVREQLRLGREELPEARLQALWRALDEDASGFISAGEFGKFMRLGLGEAQQERVRRARRQVQQRLAAQKRAQAEEHEARVGRDLTARLAEVPRATLAEAEQLSALCNQRMAAAPPLALRSSRSAKERWFKFFKLMDDDGSGRIAYAELRRGLRELLRLGREELPEARLQALWRALDEDASGFISAGEFLRFARRGQHVQPPAEASQWMLTQQATRRRVHDEEEEWATLAVSRAERAQGEMAREAARLEQDLRKSRQRKSSSSAALPALDAARTANVLLKIKYPTEKPLPPVHPQAAGSAFAARASRFDY